MFFDHLSQPASHVLIFPIIEIVYIGKIKPQEASIDCHIITNNEFFHNFIHNLINPRVSRLMIMINFLAKVRNVDQYCNNSFNPSKKPDQSVNH